MRWDGGPVRLGGCEGWGHVEAIRKVMLVVGIVHGRAGKLPVVACLSQPLVICWGPS